MGTSPETEPFSISGTEGKTINRSYPSARWKITPMISTHRCFYWTNTPLCLFPRSGGPDLVPLVTVLDQFTPAKSLMANFCGLGTFRALWPGSNVNRKCFSSTVEKADRDLDAKPDCCLRENERNPLMLASINLHEELYTREGILKRGMGGVKEAKWAVSYPVKK